MNRETHEMLNRLERAGISTADAFQLRRIAMTLHRWHELECGNSNDYQSWAIERDDNGDGPPYMVHHHYSFSEGGRTGIGTSKTTRERIPDRERGALKRLADIVARYPGLSSYVQGDPRGAPLYILKPGDVPEGGEADSYYNRGVAVY